MSNKKLLKKVEGKKHDRKPSYSRKTEPTNESFADRAIQAELDHAMGIGNEDYDWLVEPYK